MNYRYKPSQSVYVLVDPVLKLVSSIHNVQSGNYTLRMSFEILDYYQLVNWKNIPNYLLKVPNNFQYWSSNKHPNCWIVAETDILGPVINSTCQLCLNNLT